MIIFPERKYEKKDGKKKIKYLTATTSISNQDE